MEKTKTKFRTLGNKFHLRRPKPESAQIPSAVGDSGPSLASEPAVIATGSSISSIFAPQLSPEVLPSTAAKVTIQPPSKNPVETATKTSEAIGIPKGSVVTPPETIKHTPIGHTVLHGLKTVLEIATESADAFGPLKSVLGGIRAILKVSGQYSGNKEKFEAILNRLEAFKVWDTGSQENEKEVTRRESLQRKLDPILTHLKGMSEQSRIERLANSTHDEQLLLSCVEDIRDALMDYQISLQWQLLQLDLETMDKVELGLLSQMPRAQDAGYLAGNRKKCLRGTRADVLQGIHSWAEDRDNLRVYWLNGVAGTGKSTIAQSFAEDCFADGLLGASFFCSRDFTNRSNINLIFPTLAFDLAFRYPAFRAALLRIITTIPNLGSASLSTQVQRLLIEPLKLAQISTIIVIDALDECNDDEPASVILSLLGRYMDAIPLVKFFITGRPESRIRSGFRLPLLKPHTEVFLLHGVERTSVDHDIKLYLRTRLAEIVQNRSGLDLTEGWPSSEEIDILVQKSGGLFIFASITCEFIASEHGDPQDLLQTVVSIPDGTSYEGSWGVDALYGRILEDNYASVHRKLGILERMQAILGAIVLGFNPLSRTTIATLLGIKLADVWTSLRPLHSLLLIPDAPTEFIRVFHKSFPDFITDSERCTLPMFCIQPSVHHTQLAIRCLQLMKTNLKKNICNLPRYVMNKDVKDLLIRRKECIGDALEYACRFWAQHLCLASIAEGELGTVTSLLEELMQKHLLSWLEVSSICNELPAAAASLHDIQHWLVKVEGSNGEISESVRDSERFLLRFFDPTQESAAHIYDSALSWSPEDSLVRKRYQTYESEDVKLTNAIESSWDNCIVQMDAGFQVHSITFSHNGELVGCCGMSDRREGFLRLFSVATGSLHVEFQPQQQILYRLAFSPDDAIIASASEECRIPIWDVKTGDVIITLSYGDGTQHVETISFSPSGLLAVGDSAGSVRLWDISSGDCVGSDIRLRGGSIWSICWSPSDHEFAVARDLKDMNSQWMSQVEVWDSSPCKPRPIDFGKCYGGSISYSPDGLRLASSNESTIVIRDARTGVVLQNTSTSEGISSDICFSPYGDRIAYGTSSGLSIWDLESGVNRPICKCTGIELAAFSPDGFSIATAFSSDSVVKVWHVAQADSQNTRLSDETSDLTGLFLSWDGELVVSTSDGPIKLWDTLTGTNLTIFIDPGLIPEIDTSATISNDAMLVASFSLTNLRIWSCSTGTLVKTFPHRVGPNMVPTSLRFSPNNLQIVAIFDQWNLYLWDLETMRRIYPSEYEGPCSSLKINERGEFIEAHSLQALPPGRKWMIGREGGNVFSELTSMDWGAMGSPYVEHVGPWPFPYGYVPVVDDPLAEPYLRQLSMALGGWVIDRSGLRIFWIPEDLRAGFAEWCGTRLVLGTKSAKVVVMDFLGVPFQLV